MVLSFKSGLWLLLILMINIFYGTSCEQIQNLQDQQHQLCTIVSAILYPGQSTIYQQENNGFCKEWIVGSVHRLQRVLISFLNVDIVCENKSTSASERILVYNEDRSFLLYDYCLHKSPVPTAANFVMANAKYLIVRMQSLSARPMSAIFEMALLDPSSTGFISTLEPSLLLHTTSLMPTIKDDQKSQDICSSSQPKEINDIYGTIKSPIFKADILNTNCFWLIRAPPSQRVYMMFDFINLPNNMNGALDSFGCGMNYITIASKNKPNEIFKLCGNRRGVKLITTYNNVLINLVTHSLNDLAAGFSLAFRVISDPSALMPISSSTNLPSEFSSSSIVQPVSVGGNYECGIPENIPNDPTSIMRIVGGTEAAANSWPWQVMITDGLIMCGGSLINNYWIVTAAHCTENINGGPIKAYLGMHNRLRSEPSKIVKPVSRVVIHPNYLGRLTQWDYDIALMKLQEPVVFGSNISPICLPPQGTNLAKLGARGIVTGWGDTQGTGFTNILRQTTITVKKNSECGASSNNMLCAGEKVPELHDSCQGDSGGPFVMKNSNRYFLVGLVSWGYDCNGAGVYTKVSNFVDWIKSVSNTY